MKYGKRYWELKTPNPFAEGGAEEIFKCTKCGGETFPETGWNGEPKPHVCSKDCQMDHGDASTAVSRQFIENLAAINWAGHEIKPKEVRRKGSKTVYVF
jgi:hypothetical protein